MTLFYVLNHIKIFDGNDVLTEGKLYTIRTYYYNSFVDSNQYQVNEVADAVYYFSPYHFEKIDITQLRKQKNKRIRNKW